MPPQPDRIPSDDDARLGLAGSDRRQRLDRARLCVLLGGISSESEFADLAEKLVAAGVHAIQLREKRLDDRHILERARLLRELTRSGRVLFIVNDRPDIAVLSDADGVHVGQEDLPVADVRRIVGPDCLVGVSTHSIDQARRAVTDGADYIGCGPTFPSTTKAFERFAGVPFLRAASREIQLPAFAIGGIARGNLAKVIDAGFRRIAVSGAIVRAEDPTAEAAALLAQLDAAVAGRLPI